MATTREIQSSGENAPSADAGELRYLLLEQRVRMLEAQLANARPDTPSTAGSESLAPADIKACLVDVLGVTEDLFPGGIRLELLRDPDAGDSLIVFNVRSSLSTDELVNRHVEWHHRVSAVAPGISTLFCLSVVPDSCEQKNS